MDFTRVDLFLALLMSSEVLHYFLAVTLTVRFTMIFFLLLSSDLLERRADSMQPRVRLAPVTHPSIQPVQKKLARSSLHLSVGCELFSNMQL